MWSAEWGWTQRVKSWDAEVDREARYALIETQAAAKKRHASVAHEALDALAVPIQAVLKAAKDPAFLQRLEDFANASAEQALLMMRDIARFAAVVPGLVATERLSLGLGADQPTEVVDREDRVPLSERILQNPQATELAIQLLDKLAHALPPGQPVIDAVTVQPVQAETNGHPNANGHPNGHGEATEEPYDPALDAEGVPASGNEYAGNGHGPSHDTLALNLLPSAPHDDEE
jgi:hypothetical protein